MATDVFHKKDWIAAIIVTVIILMIGAINLTKGVPDWGDDYAAYISEGIAIAEGDFQEQAVKNYTMHPSPLTLEASEEGLVYVWGYPLMLSGIYKLVGFDRISFNTIIWYKIPLLLSLSFLGGVLVLFFRRRFSLRIAIVLSMLMCMSGDLFPALNKLYSDLPFLFFSMLTILLAETFAERSENGNEILLCIGYGIALWLTHEIRLNGLTVCSVALLGHILYIIKNRKLIQKHRLWKDAVPYLIFASVSFITEHFWLAPATSNMSDVGRASASQLRANFFAYRNMLFDYLDSLPGMHLFCLGYILAIAVIIGIIFYGIKDNLHLTLLLVGTLVVDILLPYQQGVRYIYNVLPLLLMFAAYGILYVWKKIKKFANPVDKNKERVLHQIGTLLCVYILIFPMAHHVITGINNINNWSSIADQDVYADQAVEMYNYIQMNVPEEAIIAFGKPRALYLNTGRLSIRTGYNGHKISDANYYLEYQLQHSEFDPEKKEASQTQMDLVYENKLFKLFSVSKSNSEAMNEK